MASLILDSLEIRNFRGFQHLTIERLGRVNLIVGKNNVGKSNLLMALQLYARRASSPTFIWEILSTRGEIKRPFEKAEDMLIALKYLFYGRKEIAPGHARIEIGSLHNILQRLSIAVDWSIIQVDQNGQHIRPLQPEEPYTLDALVPRFVIQTEGAVVSYPIMPTLPIGIVRLNVKEIPCAFVTANGLQHASEMWDNIALTSQEKDVLEALRLIAPGVEGISFVRVPLFTEREPIVRVMGIDEPIPLSNLGDGMQRMLGIALALVNAKNGFLLIDEIENGLHYLVQPDLWKLIFQTARRLNIQVFATTHSWDCIEGFQHASQIVDNEEGLLIRLESKEEGIKATLFDKRRLNIATREQIEVR